MKLSLLAFASHHMTKGFPRFVEQAKTMKVFDEILTCSEKDLDKDFRRKFGRHLVKYSRGYGYWSWKPYIILQALEKLGEEDILVYMDTGCFMNPRGRARLLEYIEMVKTNEQGILAIRSQGGDYNKLPEKLHYEHHWTKGDVFAHFNGLDDKNMTHSTQYEATVIFFRKTDFSLNFVKEWLQVFSDNFSLIDDSPSKTPNFPEFIEHRHDQSIYSMLAKKYKLASFPTAEIFQERDWDLIADYPIHARRDKVYPSKLHYRLRFRIRQLYACWAKLKYGILDLFSKK